MTTIPSFLLRGALVLLPLLPLNSWAADAVRGAGATFPSAVYKTWMQKYEAVHGRAVSYEPTGSGDGQKKIIARAVDFAGSDVPLSEAELRKNNLVQLPMLVGGIVPVVNLRLNAPLRLEGAVLADIFRGTITRWNHPRIAELNPGVALPAQDIVRIVRKEKSGSSDAFSRYLALVSPDFGKAVAPGMLPKWTGEVVAAEGNDGIVKAIQATPGAISYVSYDRLLKAKLQGVRLRNPAGNFVGPSEAAFRDAVRNSALSLSGDENASLLNRHGADAWPITVTSYILVDAQPKDAASAQGPLHFLHWTLQSGDRLLNETGFAPLPIAVQARLAARLASVRAQNGQMISYF